MLLVANSTFQCRVDIVRLSSIIVVVVVVVVVIVVVIVVGDHGSL